MTAGLSLGERAALRERYRRDAIKRAEQLGRTLRCQAVADDMDNPEHQLCRGEDKGGPGCLCRCHDIVPDLARADDLAGAMPDIEEAG